MTTNRFSPKRVAATTIGAALLVGSVSGLALTLPSSALTPEEPVAHSPSADHGPDATGHPRPAGHAHNGRTGMAPGKGMGMGQRSGDMLNAAAGTIGLDPGDLRAQMREGRSLAAIAEANGVDTDTLVDAMVEANRSRITDMVQRPLGAPEDHPSSHRGPHGGNHKTHAHSED